MGPRTNALATHVVIGAPRWLTPREERAHAMKNRLSTIRALARLVGRGLPPEAQRRMDLLEESVRELATFLDQELVESTSEPRRITADATGAIDVPALFAAAGRCLEGQAVEAQVSLTFDCAPATLHGIEVDLSEAAHNLLANAVAATPAGGSVCVRTRVTPSGEHVWEVEDSGDGIPREVVVSVGLHRSTKRPGGSGLGLAIAAAAFAAHGGLLEVFTGHGGTRVTARLPDPFAASVPAGGSHDLVSAFST